MKHYEFGDGNGIPLILHLGTPGRGELGEELHKLASDAGIRLICPTRPWYDDEDVEPNFDVVSSGTINYLKDRGIQSAHAMGGSGGGPFALHLALCAGQRIDDCTLLAATGEPGVFANSVKSPHTKLLLEIFADRDYGRWKDTMGGWGVTEDLSRGAWKDFVAFYDNWPRMALVDACPIFVYHGENDPNAPLEAVKTLVKGAPTVSWHVTDEADHIAMAKDPSNGIFSTIFGALAARHAASHSVADA